MKDDRKMKIVQLANNIIDNIFQDEQMDYSDALDGFLKLAISDNTFYKILKTDIPILEKVREMIKTRKEEKVQNNLQGVNFKTILHKTGEKMKKSKFPTLTKLKNIDKQMQISNLEITQDNGLIAQDER